MANDYISREAVKNAIHRDLDMQDLYLPIEFIELLDDIPTADVRPVVRGKWKHINNRCDGYAWQICSECGEKGKSTWNFCRNCGCAMENEK